VYEDLLKREWPQDSVIGEGILSIGDRLVLGGEPKSGKSILLAQMIRGLCMGTDFLGFKIPKARRVLYVQAELREGRLKQRLLPWQSWADKNGIKFPPDMFYAWSTNGPLYLTQPLPDKAPHDHPLERLYRELDEIKPEVIVFDPLASFHDMNENDSREMKQLTEVVDKVKEHMDLAVVIAHHFRKGNMNDKTAHIPLHDRIRGSSVMTAWADSIIAIFGNQNTKDVKHLEFLLRDSDEHPERVLVYNAVTKSFDYFEPYGHATAWTKTFFATGKKDVPSTEFITELRKACPAACKGSQNEALTLKDRMITDGILTETRAGKSKLLNLAPI
jgi:RecA-family ATPase